MAQVRLDRDQTEFVRDLKVCAAVCREAMGDVFPDVVFELLDRGVADLSDKDRNEIVDDLKKAISVTTEIFTDVTRRTPEILLTVFEGLFPVEDDDVDDDENEDDDQDKSS
mgnify:FL=1